MMKQENILVLKTSGSSLAGSNPAGGTKKFLDFYMKSNLYKDKWF